MTLRWVKVSRRPPWPCWAVLIACLWGGLVAAAICLARATGREVILCPLKLLTGLPCPTCGLTRGTLALLSGHVLKAWALNPLAFSAAAVYLAVVGIRIVLGRAVRLELAPSNRRVAWVVAAVLVGANWTYVIACVG